jgi:hypothetical protein
VFRDRGAQKGKKAAREVTVTGKTFKWHVVCTILIVVVASIVAVYASFIWEYYKDGLRTAPAILIPIGAAWLAFCWQRRVSFTKALFDVWQSW